MLFKIFFYQLHSGETTVKVTDLKLRGKKTMLSLTLFLKKKNEKPMRFSQEVLQKSFKNLIFKQMYSKIFLENHDDCLGDNWKMCILNDYFWSG